MRDYQKNTIATYNKIAKHYQTKRDKFSLDPEMKKFQKLITGKKILDIGTAAGRDTEIFIQDGFQVTGIDLAQEFINRAKKNVPEATFKVMDVLALKFKPETFAGVWCNATLHHLKKKDLPKALAEINRVLKPNGIFFVCGKAGTGEKTVLEKEFNNQPRFFSYFSEPELKKYLQQTGFEVLETYTSNDRQRFGPEYRDVDFILAFARKK